MAERTSYRTAHHSYSRNGYWFWLSSVVAGNTGILRHSKQHLACCCRYGYAVVNACLIVCFKHEVPYIEPSCALGRSAEARHYSSFMCAVRILLLILQPTHHSETV